MAHSPFHRTALPGLALAACAALAAGCPSKPADPAGLDATVVVVPEDASTSTPDTGTNPDGPDTGPTPGLDAGTPDTGPAAQPCSNDDECGPTERCSEAGACMPAMTCDEPANCVPGNDQDTDRLYCDNTTGLGCRCVRPATAPDAGTGADGGALGYCKRRLPPCAPCESDEQCGDSAFFRNLLHEPAKCLPHGGVKVCLEQYVSAKCACGKSTFINGAPYCTPQAPLTCAEGLLCCSDNAQCPPEHPFCGASGRCEDVCWYDYNAIPDPKTVGCRADKVCNVDPFFLFPPENPLYGAGRCANPCTSDKECQDLYGRQDYVCRPEGKSAPRCRPQGCIDDGECPSPDISYGYMGYCNRATQVCVCKDPGNPALTCNCRTTVNPVTNQPYKDCVDGYKCVEPGAGQPGQCVEKTCSERNGAQAYCRYGQFCCGEDRDQDGVTEACTDPTGTAIPLDPERLQCYYAPSAHWCVACDSQPACNVPTLPVSKHQPTPDYNLCLNTGDTYGARCHIACMFDSECPKGFGCTDIPVPCDQCPDPAKCYDTGLKDQDGNPIKQCGCTNKGQKGGECPALDPADQTQPVARCSDTLDTRNNNNTYFCQWSRVCSPSVAGIKNACITH